MEKLLEPALASVSERMLSGEPVEWQALVDEIERDLGPDDIDGRAVAMALLDDEQLGLSAWTVDGVVVIGRKVD